MQGCQVCPWLSLLSSEPSPAPGAAPRLRLNPSYRSGAHGWPGLRRSRPEANFFIAGRGDQRPSLRSAHNRGSLLNLRLGSANIQRQLKRQLKQVIQRGSIFFALPQVDLQLGCAPGGSSSVLQVIVCNTSPIVFNTVQEEGRNKL